ncbi:MAG: hypothetical protein MJ211_09155 [Bacteroidales bacterium]|nr:hypothetical protein [Bacteroidales bacterium]
MKELIDNELAQLQKDLENLQSASKQIANAGEASNKVIQEAKNIQDGFSKNLEKITGLYTQYLDEADKNSSKRNDQIVDYLKKTISEQTTILDKYGALVSTINDNSKSLLEKSELNQKNMIEQLLKSAQDNIKSQDNLLKKTATETSQKVDDVKKTYLKQAEETDKLLSSYLELAQSTAELKNNIDKVDFPKRLDNISNLVSALNNEQQSANEVINQILSVTSDKKIKNLIIENNKKLGTIKTLVWLIFIIFILVVGAVIYYCIHNNIIIPANFL